MSSHKQKLQSRRREGSEDTRKASGSPELTPRATRSSSRGERKEEGEEVSSPAMASTSKGKPSIRSVSHVKKMVKIVRPTDRSKRLKGSKEELEDDDEVFEVGAVVSESTDSDGSESERAEGEKRKGRGRPATVPGHEGQSTADVLFDRRHVERIQRQEEAEDMAFDPAVTLRYGPKLAKVRREEQEMLLGLKEVSTTGITAMVMEQVTQLRKMAQCCTNLKGTTIKSLWDTTTTISAAASALNLRAQNTGQAVVIPEWEKSREETRQLRGGLAHLRTECKSLRNELRKEKKERERVEKLLKEEEERRIAVPPSYKRQA